MKLLHHPTIQNLLPILPSTESFDLAVQIAAFSTSPALTPAQVHNAPSLGQIAWRKYLERGFTYGVRRATCLHMSRAAAAA